MIVGVATAWNDDKGLKDYVSLSRMLGEEYQIALIGVSESVREILPNRVIGIPKTDSIDKLSFIYSLADVVTSLSYAESLGMTPIEGMACGTPAIVYDNTAQPELIDEKCGLVVPTGDIEALKKAIEEIKIKEKKSYSKACVERVRKYFNKEERYNDYINLYKELCGQKNW